VNLQKKIRNEDTDEYQWDFIDGWEELE